MCLGVFQGYAQVEATWLQNIAFFRYLEIFNCIVFFGIEFGINVGSQPFTQVHIIAIAAQVASVKGFNDNGTLFHLFEYTAVRKNHGIIFSILCKYVLILHTIGKVTVVPLYYQQDINENTRLAIWEIAEEPAFFLEKVSLRYPVVHPQKQLQHLAAGYLLPYLYPDFPYQEVVYPEQGRPYVPGDKYFFSLTHSGGMAAAMVSASGAVGIDLEKITDRVHRIRHKFLSVEEWEWVQGRGEEVQRELLTLLWTVKEAVYKWRNRPGTVFSQDILVSPILLSNAGTIDVMVADEPLVVFYRRVGEYYISYVGGERPV
jgi:hypothetical protein